MSAPRKRTSKRAAAPADDSSDEAAAYAAMGRRSYNSLGYWDERYQRHFAQERAAAAVSAAAGNASSSSSSSAAAAASSIPVPPAALAAPAGDDVSSNDITAEWYYSWNDLEPMLSKALKGVDRSGAVLDIGCGLSTFFLDLQRGGGGSSEGATAAKSAAKASSSAAAAGSRGLGFTGPCIGIDYSPSVIAHLQAKYPHKQHPQITWLCADACYLLEDKPAAAAAASSSSASKGAQKGERKAAALQQDDDVSSNGLPPLSPSDRARFFKPGSFSLILDKATSDGMLCSDRTALLTPLMYANVARLLAPGGLFVIASVNDPESGWFGEHVVSQLIEHGGEDDQANYTWAIEVHTASTYSDGEEGAPNVYLIKKVPQRPGRSTTTEQREPYTIKQLYY